MRKILVNFLVFMLLCINGVMAQFEGSGTESDPYLISSQENLLALSNAVNSGNSFSGKFFLQTVDINFVDSQIFPNGFAPIGGVNGEPFSGTYDGGGHMLYKMVIYGSTRVAMFSNLQNACVKNLNLENVNFTGESFMGQIAGVAAESSNSQISNVTVSGQMTVENIYGSATIAGIVGNASRTSISGCVSMLTFETHDFSQEYPVVIAGIAICDARTTMENCFVSTFIRGSYSEYYPIANEGTATKCLVAESNAGWGGIDSNVTYNHCYFDQQNTTFAEGPNSYNFGMDYPFQGVYIDGFTAKKTAELTTGSLFNDANWTETAGLYPRPAGVANTNAAILAAAPRTFNVADCMKSVAFDFTVSTENNVTWDTESDFIRISGGNVSVHEIAVTVEMYAYRNNLVKYMQITPSYSETIGSRRNPYHIASEADLLAVASMYYNDNEPDSSQYFNFDINNSSSVELLLDNDITITNASEWLPIGNSTHKFTGVFDGGGHTIYFNGGTIYYDNEGDDEYSIGLFGGITSASILNLTVSYDNSATAATFGGIAVSAQNSRLYNCKVTGDISLDAWEGSSTYGGLVGYASSTTFDNCANYASINANDGECGGILGYGSNVVLYSCANMGDISGNVEENYVGGLVGSIYNNDQPTESYSSIRGCANYADVQDHGTFSGAIVGSASCVIISDCANYGGQTLSLIGDGSNATFTNNINVPRNASQISYDTDLSTIFMPDIEFISGDSQGINTYTNNFTDKQMFPASGNCFGLSTVSTSDLTSGNVDLDYDKWIFTSGRYPMPAGTDVDNAVVKLATTPIILAVTDDENYETVKSVRSNFTLGSGNGISWMIDSVPVTGSTISPEEWKLDSTNVTKTITSYIGETQRSFDIVIPARAGTPENPLLIESVNDFNMFAQAIANSTGYKGMSVANGGAGLNFKLTADISNANQVNGFSGNFNGGGHTITVSDNNLHPNSACGLFSTISYARIDSLNVTLSGSASTGTNGSYASILCANATNSTISNCTVSITNGSFSSSVNCGLVCGLLQNSRLIGCSTEGYGYTVQSGDYSAGLVSCSKNSTISNCTNGISMSSQVGCVTAGIVSRAYSLTLENCTNNGDIINNQAAYLTYTAGIVGKVDDSYSPEYSYITNAVNNGMVKARNNNRGLAAGIVCGYNTSSGSATVKVKNCVNAGNIIGGDGAAGIAYEMVGEISNCANYGNVESPSDIAGIKCKGSSCTSVGNIVACQMVMEYDDMNSYSQDVMSPDADDDDFFDEQITEIKVDSLRLGFYDHGTPRTTQGMVGSALASALPGDWDFAEGLYPLPAGLDPNDSRNKLARLPVIFKSDAVGRSERITGVISNITLPQVEGVTWETSNPDVISVPSGGGVATVTNPSEDSTVTITATCGDYSRSYTFTVHKAQGTTADNPYIISDCYDLFYSMCNNDRYPAGGYGLYFKLGESFEISRSEINFEATGGFRVKKENLNVLFPESYPFRGTLDGDGHTLTWANSEYTDEYYGLFKYTDGAEISNLAFNFTDSQVSSAPTTLIGQARATTIRNCAVYVNYSNQSTSDYMAGMVYRSLDGTLIDGCMVVGTLSAKHISGIVHDAEDTRIANTVSMINAKGEGGSDHIDEVAAIANEVKNVVIDSCLIIGSYIYQSPSYVCANSGAEVNNTYYDRQQWNYTDDAYSLRNYAKETSELLGDGIFAGSSKWVHNEGKYPVPAGTENFAHATLASTPLLIGENDVDVTGVTNLRISNENSDNIQWTVNTQGTTAAVNSDLTVNCVDEPESSEIIATLADSSATYTFTREIGVTKGLLNNIFAPEPEFSFCEGSTISIYAPSTDDAIYEWSVEPELEINDMGNDTISVTIPNDYLLNYSGNIAITLLATFEGDCQKTVNYTYGVMPSPTHVRLNDTAVCNGSDLTLSFVADEGYEDYIEIFFYHWGEDEYITDQEFGNSTHYIPMVSEETNVSVNVDNFTCSTNWSATISVIEVAPITVVSGEPNQWICQGEFMEPVVLSVEKPTYYLPEGVYADYNDDEAQLTLSGRPFYSSQNDYSYTIYGCGSTYNGEIFVSERTRIHTDGSFSQVLNLGDDLNNIRLEDIGWEYNITVESLDGTETFTIEDLGLYISNMDRIDFLSGTPQMPGEFIYHIIIPENGACPAIVYDNFLGVYDTEELSATALSTTLCVGETATLATVERPGAYGGEYVWTLEEDTVGTGSRINVIPPLGTSTYEVACGGKRMYGEFEIGDYVYLDEQLGENAYSMRKNTEITMYDYQTGYMIANVEQDSLLLMSLAKLEETVWSYDTVDVSGNTNYATVADAMNDMNGRANSMLLADDETSAAAMLSLDDLDMYLPSAGELGYILNNYDKFYFALEYDLPVMLSSTEKDANTVYVLNVNYGRMMEYPKTEIATAMGFKKIPKSKVVNMVGRTSNISRTASVDIIVSERQDMSVSTDDVLCNTDTAHVAIETEYPIVNWYNAISSDEQVVVENGTAVLPEGSYIAIGTDEYGSCHDTLEVKVKDLAFYMPQDTTVCDSAVLTIAKEDVTVMLGDEVIDGQTITITESGTYDITLIGIGDTCREEKTINVTVNQSYSISFDTIVLDSEFVWNGETYSATGDYEQRFTSVGGCDSVVTVHLTIVNTETEFAVYGNVTEGDGVSLLSGVNVVSLGASTFTDEAGHYVIMVQRTNPILQFAKAGYNFVFDTIAESGQHNVAMLKPEMNLSLSDDSYETNPYVMRQFTVQLSNTGDGPMAWSSIVETEHTRNVMHRRNGTTMWEYADTVIRTNANAEQAIASDGYYIYTASWQRAGEFSRYSIDNGYLETFIIDGVGRIRNMTYGNGFFFATDNTNKIYKINMDSQSLDEVITLNDPDLQIRYCAYSTAEDLLYIGNWTNLYKLVAYNTAYPTLIPLSYSMDNVYSIAYDAFSGTTPCLWAFSQVSENNGPFAKIYKLNTNGVQIEGIVHYINDASLATASSLAGGICVSQYLYDDRFVLLANVQNTNAANNIAVYELGRKNSWVSTDVKSGIIPAGGSIDVTITEYAVENGNYTANVKFKPVVCMPEISEISLSMSVSTPQCSPVTNLVAETDTFHTVSLSWDAAELGDYESVAYLLYEEGTEMPIDTVEATTYMVSNPEVGTHCYFVRTLMRGEADCVSEASNTACAEIEAFPCDVQLTLTARAYGDRIKLEWNALYGVETYGVFSAEPGGEGLYIGSETTFVDTLVMPETDYCYKVVAYFANGECQSIESNDACARIASAGCSELPVVTAKAIGNSVAVSWTRVGDVNSYSLYKDGKYLTSTSDTLFYDMMLDYETEYCYVVEIDCGYGNYGLSESACATTDAEVIEENGVELLDAESFELYPNPASDMFYIEGKQMQGIQIVNFAGQVVYELDNAADDRLTVDVSGFAPGVYAVRIILSDSRSVVKRIVIGR